MNNSTELTTKNCIDPKKSDPYLTLVKSRVNNLSKNSEYAELMLCKKSFIRLLKSKVSIENDNEFIEGYNKYTERLSIIIHTLKNNLEYSQECLQSHKQEIENLRAALKDRSNIKDELIDSQFRHMERLQRVCDGKDQKIASLEEDLNLLKANPERRKGGTIAYFGKLSIAN